MSIEKTKSCLYLEREYDIGDIVLTVIMDTGFFYTDRLTYEPHMHMEHEVHIPISGEYSVEQFALENWGIDTEPGFENIHEDADVIPQYCSIYACYTDTTFYYCLVVKDLIHYNNGHDNAYSGGDSCFFNMVGDRDATTDDDRLRYCMALTNSGEIKCINYGSAPISTEDDWVVTRDEASKTTTYEISVPFEPNERAFSRFYKR